mgnify:CR=1 FL=1
MSAVSTPNYYITSKNISVKKGEDTLMTKETRELIREMAEFIERYVLTYESAKLIAKANILLDAEAEAEAERYGVAMEISIDMEGSND